MTSDPQFGIVRVLRPYSNFETEYQGQPAATTPILLSEAGVALDDSAQSGEIGYDPNLVRGLAVPLGSRVLLWLPNVFAAALPTLVPYVYTLIWRYRNTADNRRTRAPYHYPKQIDGIPETIVNPGPRVVIPAATQSVIYNQVEGAAISIQTQNMHSESIAAGGDQVGLVPINPGGVAGVIQQGVLPSSAGSRLPFFSPMEFQAEGDELLISVLRLDNFSGASPNWEFGALEVDRPFSNFYGQGLGSAFPDLGVYVTVGAAS